MNKKHQSSYPEPFKFYDHYYVVHKNAPSEWEAKGIKYEYKYISKNTPLIDYFCDNCERQIFDAETRLRCHKGRHCNYNICSDCMNGKHRKFFDKRMVYSFEAK